MLFKLTSSMEPSYKCEQGEMGETKTETTENASDRESSIESFHTNKSELSTTTETELIDVDDIELSDEESWLYKSPKKQLSEEKSANTEKWLEKSIDDMDDVELKATRTALLSKLNQLKMLNSSISNKEPKQDDKALNLEKSVNKTTETTSGSCLPKLNNHGLKEETSTSSSEKSTFSSEKSTSISEKSTSMSEKSTSSSETNSGQESLKKSVFDVLDVQKIARLQEESLKQNTYKFLNHSGKRTMSNRDFTSMSPAQVSNLNKPASYEALNTCADKVNHANVYAIVPIHGMKKQNMFNSSSALNSTQDFHRSSLPNINKGYYSLKSKKSKRPSEPKVSCPLPIYPTHSKVHLNGTTPQRSFDSHIKSADPSYDHRETRTLPSSYRIHSRSNSSSRKEGNVQSPSPRRESMPFLGTNSMERNSHRKYSSPVSSAAMYPRNSISSATCSPTKAFNSLQQNPRSPPGLDYHRATSHSPARRLPLSTVQHQSPKKGNSLAFPKNGEIKTLKVPSKIPSPASRSGIPVPSATSRANEDDTWSQDCF